LKNKYNKKGFKTKQITIKRLGTKLDIKINENKILRVEIEKNQLGNR
jgi:hypothetical protein